MFAFIMYFVFVHSLLPLITFNPIILLSRGKNTIFCRFFLQNIACFA